MGTSGERAGPESTRMYSCTLRQLHILGLNRSEVKVTNRHKALGGTLQLHKLQHLLLEVLLELLDHLHPPSAGGGST